MEGEFLVRIPTDPQGEFSTGSWASHVLHMRVASVAPTCVTCHVFQHITHSVHPYGNSSVNFSFKFKKNQKKFETFN